jgi:hypothetical protein
MRFYPALWQEFENFPSLSDHSRATLRRQNLIGTAELKRRAFCREVDVAAARASHDERFQGDGAMRTDTAPTCDWIASVVLFAFAILIILVFGFF